MAVLTLPTSPAPQRMGIQLMSNRGVLTSALGGDEQERQRKGSRYALTFSMPPMTYTNSMAWDDLNAEAATVLMNVYQPGFSIGSPGTVRVNGAGQAGTSLIVDGATAGYAFKKGQFVSIVTSSRRYLYRLAADVTANGSGQATLTLRTMLRFPPSDNDLVEVSQPKIEGFVRDMQTWEVGVDRLVQLEFTVRERG